MSELRITTPWVRAIQWNLHPVLESVPVQTQDGRQGTQITSKQPGLVVGIVPYLGSVALAQLDYSFPAGQSLDDVLASAGLDVASAWQSALSDMADVFPVLRDPSPSDLAKGLPYYLRLDSWRASFVPTGGSTVSAILGLYASEEYKTPSGYTEIVFADASARADRENNLKQLAQQLQYAQSVLDSDDATEEQLTQATNTKRAMEIDIARMTAQQVGSMESLLALPSVGPAVGALISGVFSQLKKTDAQWVDVDLPSLMAKVVGAFSRLSGA